MKIIRKWSNCRRLQRTMRPDADYWERRLRSLSPERRKHVLANKVLP